MTYIEKDTKEYKRASIALFLGGFVTFFILYTTQPLLPVFAEEFQVSATLSSLTLSLSTGVLALVMLFAAPLSDAFGKKKVMMVSIIITAILGLVTAFSPNFIALLVCRALLGIFIAGVPSLAMAYVGEEFNPRGIGKVMGLYISGTSLGGLAGRILTGVLTDLFSWRIALVIIGLLSLVLSVIFIYALPTPRRFKKNPLQWGTSLSAYKKIIVKKRLMALIFLAFLLMGSFVTLFNYIGFLLMEPPYNLSQTFIGFIFIANLCGTFSSVFMGKQADKHGNFPMLLVSLAIFLAGVLITLFAPLVVKIIGIGVFTFGFFASHSIASAWIGEDSGSYKAQASSLYLLLYYLGSSIVGSVGGYFWTHFHWNGVISLVSVLLITAFPLIIIAQRNKQVTGQYHHISNLK